MALQYLVKGVKAGSDLKLHDFDDCQYIGIDELKDGGSYVSPAVFHDAAILAAEKATWSSFDFGHLQEWVQQDAQYDEYDSCARIIVAAEFMKASYIARRSPSSADAMLESLFMTLNIGEVSFYAVGRALAAAYLCGKVPVKESILQRLLHIEDFSSIVLPKLYYKGIVRPSVFHIQTVYAHAPKAFRMVFASFLSYGVDVVTNYKTHEPIVFDSMERPLQATNHESDDLYEDEGVVMETWNVRQSGLTKVLKSALHGLDRDALMKVCAAISRKPGMWFAKHISETTPDVFDNSVSDEILYQLIDLV